MTTMEITSNEEFEKIMEKGFILIDFNAPWCAPCRSQEPIIDHLALSFEGRAIVAAMNIDNHQDIAAQLSIQSIPTLIIFENGKELQRFIGLQSESTLADAIEEALN